MCGLERIIFCVDLDEKHSIFVFVFDYIVEYIYASTKNKFTAKIKPVRIILDDAEPINLSFDDMAPACIEKRNGVDVL